MLRHEIAALSRMGIGHGSNVEFSGNYFGGVIFNENGTTPPLIIIYAVLKRFEDHPILSLKLENRGTTCFFSIKWMESDK